MSRNPDREQYKFRCCPTAVRRFYRHQLTNRASKKRFLAHLVIDAWDWKLPTKNKDVLIISYTGKKFKRYLFAATTFLLNRHHRQYCIFYTGQTQSMGVSFIRKLLERKSQIQRPGIYLSIWTPLGIGIK